MSYSRLVLNDKPEIIWPLDRITDSSASSNPIDFISNKSASYYSASINTSVSNVFEIPIIFSGGTALNLSSQSTAGLSIPLVGRLSESYSNKESSIEFWLRVDKTTTGEITLVKKRNFDNVGLFLNESYLIYRYGPNSSSYLEVSYALADLSQPTHIVMNYSNSGIDLIVNGVYNSTTNPDKIKLPANSSDISNDRLDFYGHPNFNVIFDAIAIYSYRLNSVTAKKHYIYGLGKDFDEDIIFSMGGDLYNFSNSSSRKSYSAYWDFPEEWELTRYNNVIHTDNGITLKTPSTPVLYSYDNNILKTNNMIEFSSGGNNTISSYIDINNISNVLEGDVQTFFVKIKLNGQLPPLGNSQTILSYSKEPLDELINFNLKNVENSYYIFIEDMDSSLSSSFAITNITSSPTVYIGYGFSDKSNLYFAESGQSIQTSSFSFLDIDGFGTDPMQNEFPAQYSNAVRIGSRSNYNSSYSIAELNNINQFYGTFIKFLVVSNSENLTTYTSLENYDTSTYSFYWNSTESRYKVSSYGNVNAIFHGTQIAEPRLTSSAIISSNKLTFGYPEVLSGAQVKFYGTLYDYDDNVLYAKTELSSTNHLEWMNIRDLSNTYLSIDIDIKAEDTLRYKPFVRYLYFETYPFSGSYTEIQDDGGNIIKLYSASNAFLALPEIKKTPTTILNDDSGIKLYLSTADILFSPVEKQLNLNALDYTQLWLEARSINGSNKTSGLDATAISTWKDLSLNSITSTVSPVSASPEYRIQSLNLLRNNHANGGEDGTKQGVSNTSCVVSSDPMGAVNGDRSFKLTPTGANNNSYIEINTGSAIYPNQKYTLVADITLNKVQETTNPRATIRSIGIVETPSKETYSASALNQIGTQSVSVTFTTQSNLTNSTIRLYNGSASPSDIVYYDNIGLYSGSTVSGSPVGWYLPYEHYNDREIVRITSSVTLDVLLTASQGLTVYMVARAFGDGGFIGGISASAPSFYVNSGSFAMSAGNIIVGPINNNDYNLLVGVFNGVSSSFFVNGIGYSGNSGTGSYSPVGLKIGRSIIGTSSSYFLNGGIAALAVFGSSHNKKTIDLVSNYFKDGFNV